MTTLPQRRLLVIALDGATWTLLSPWIESGKLPTLARLIESGVSGPLTSTIPPITPVAWLTFSTGKNAARHNVFDFFRPLRHGYDDLIPTTADLNHQPMLWDILSQRGCQVGVVNVPMTYPVRPVNGFVFPGIPAPTTDEPAYPPGLHQELKQRGWDLTRNAAVPQRSFSETLAYLQSLIHTRVEATCHLLSHRPWDFFMVHFLETDQAAHTFWRFLDQKGNPFQDAILRVYEQVDRGIERILDAAGDVPVLLMSDHGMGPTHYHVNLNNWLQAEGFMSWQRRPGTALRRLAYAIGLSPTTLYRLLPDQIMRRATLGNLRTGLAQITTEHVGKRTSLPQKLTSWVSRMAFLSFGDVDWSRTVAYSTGTTEAGLIYLNVQGREPRGIVAEGQEYDRVCSQIAEKLMTFVDPYTQRQLVKRVYRRDELYHGPHLSDAPDLIVIYRYGEYDHKKGAAFLSTRPIEAVRQANATHRPDGIFALCAPEIALQGERLLSAHIRDLAPTILYLLDQAVPAELEGRVLEDALTPAYLAEHSVHLDHRPLVSSEAGQEFSADDLEAVLEKLHGLGYIS